MKSYKIKKLIDGWRVDKKFTGKTVVAVPEQKLTSDCKVIFGSEAMVIRRPGQEPLMRIAFKDKYNRGVYTLCYFEWMPELTKQLSFF